jgi:integrase
MPQRETKALTNIRINALKVKPKDYEVFDRNVGGLAVRVFPSGKKSFVVNFRVNGKRKRMTLGNPSVMSISEARQEALQLQQKAKAGTNVIQEKKDNIKAKIAEQTRAQNTFAHVTDLFIELYCIEDKNLKSWKEYKRILNKYVIPHWGNRNIEDIKKTDVTALLDSVAKNYGSYQANRVLATIRKLFNWGCVRGVVENTPIVVGMARSEDPRERKLEDDEIVIFWDGCEKLKYPYGKIFQLLLITGQRRGEVINMKWSQINMSSKVWSLPSHSTKSGLPHLVPLSQMAIDILEMLPKFADSDLLFPTEMNRDRPVGNVSVAKKRVCEIKDWRLHDLRRTVRTNLAELKVPYLICNKVLGHIDHSVEKHYDKHDYVDEKRDALETWGKRLTSILSKNVVDLKSKRA